MRAAGGSSNVPAVTDTPGIAKADAVSRNERMPEQRPASRHVTVSRK